MDTTQDLLARRWDELGLDDAATDGIRPAPTWTFRLSPPMSF